MIELSILNILNVYAGLGLEALISAVFETDQ